MEERPRTQDMDVCKANMEERLPKCKRCDRVAFGPFYKTCCGSCTGPGCVHTGQCTQRQLNVLWSHYPTYFVGGARPYKEENADAWWADGRLRMLGSQAPASFILRAVEDDFTMVTVEDQ